MSIECIHNKLNEFKHDIMINLVDIGDQKSSKILCLPNNAIVGSSLPSARKSSLHNLKKWRIRNKITFNVSLH